MRIPNESDPTLAKGKDKDDEEKDLSEPDALPGGLAPENFPANVPAPVAVADATPRVPVTAVPATMPGNVVPVAPAAVPVTAVPMQSPVATQAASLPTAAVTAVPTAIPAGMPVAMAAPVAVAPVAAVPAAMPAAVPVGVAPVAVAAVPAAVPMSMPAPYPAAAVPAAPPRPAFSAGGPLPPGLIDPLAEAPHAVWYVRPASGGQYGPARGDVLRQWIGEGRLAGDSLVWREGWADWKSAPEVFPELAGQGPAAIGPGISVEGNSAARTADYIARKRSGNSMAIAMMALLGLVCVGLLIVLIYILNQNSKPRTERNSTRKIVQIERLGTDSKSASPLPSFDQGTGRQPL